MAEPTSLALSVVTLAGLFSSCIECYRYIDNGRTQGTDSELLLCKIRIENVRFELWGQGTRYIKPPAQRWVGFARLKLTRKYSC